MSAKSFRYILAAMLLLLLPALTLADDKKIYSLDVVENMMKREFGQRKKPIPDDLRQKLSSYFSNANIAEPFSNDDFDASVNYLFQNAPPLDTGDSRNQNPLKKPASKPLWGLKIREDFNDVVEEEDPNNEKAKKRDTLAGASLNYSHNFEGSEDTWSVKGAILFPKSLKISDADPTSDNRLLLQRLNFLPSISINKLDTQGNPKDEVDSLIYRLGGGARSAFLISGGYFGEIELRAFATYGTDTSHDATIIAGQFEIEPRISHLDDKAEYALGYRASLFPNRDIPKDDPTDTSNLVYSLRLFGHGEFGKVNDTGGNPDIQLGGFFRFGPCVKLEIEPRYISRALTDDFDKVKLSISYAYYPTLSGTDPGHESYFTAGLEWTLVNGKEKGGRVSLKLNYEKGGLELTKEEVEKITLGLGITY